MDGFITILGDWHFWALAIGYYAFISIVGGMPEPLPMGSRSYEWAYKSLHLFAGNVNKLVNGRFNGAKAANVERKQP